MSNFIKQALKILFFLVFGLFLLYLIFQQQNKAYLADCALKGIPEAQCSLMDKLIADFKSVNVFYLILVMVMFTLSNISRAMRWNMLLKPLGIEPKLANSFHTLMIGYFANLALPRIGEIARGTALAKYENASTRKILGTIFVDRLLDIICMFLFVLLTLFFEYDTLLKFLKENIEKKLEQGDSITIFFVGGFVIFVLGLFLLYFFKNRIKQMKLYDKVGSLVSGFSEGIKSVKKVENPWLFLGHTIFIWIMFYLMTYFCFFSFKPTEHLNMSQAMVVAVLGTLGVILPSPGGMGTFHALVIIGLGFYNIAPSDAFSFANIQFFTIQIGYCTLMGIIAFISLPLINKKKVELSHLLLDAEEEIAKD